MREVKKKKKALIEGFLWGTVLLFSHWDFEIVQERYLFQIEDNFKSAGSQDSDMEKQTVPVEHNANYTLVLANKKAELLLLM